MGIFIKDFFTFFLLSPIYTDISAILNDSNLFTMPKRSLIRVVAVLVALCIIV